MDVVKNFDRELTEKELTERGLEGAFGILSQEEVLTRGRTAGEVLFSPSSSGGDEALYAAGTGQYDGGLFLLLPEWAYEKIGEGSSAEPNDDATQVTLRNVDGTSFVVGLKVSEDFADVPITKM